MIIKHIWIEAENSSDNRNFENENTDVIVEMKNGTKYIATFFTYKNILTLTKKNMLTGECLAGKYFWASDMLLIDNCKRHNIELVINQLLTNGEFSNIFREITS